MKYMGSKRRYVKYLLPIILENRKNGQWYVEPFVGGCNVIENVKGNRAGIDINRYLISMWQALQDGWIPPENISEEEYVDIRDNKECYPEYLIGYVGFNLSYAGKWWGGYARDGARKRNYGDEAFRHIMKQVPKIKDVFFVDGDYLEMEFKDICTIYCDPPYQNATQYKDRFDHDSFWNWCRERRAEGHKIFISEYSAPEDFKCVWEKAVNNTLVQNTGSKQGVERLFV